MSDYELWQPCKPDDMTDEEFNEIVEMIASLPLVQVMTYKEICAAIELFEKSKEDTDA